MTRVLFLIEKGSKTDVFAYFPDDKFTEFYTPLGQKITSYSCYSHIGQHSSCNIEYVNKCKRAKFNQYYDLLRELVAQGYKDLYIINGENQEIECSRKPTQFELKQGCGAYHYRKFKISEIGINKKGELKRRFKADDNLIYSTR